MVVVQPSPRNFSRASIAFRYTLFAAIATIANVVAQAVTFNVVPFSPLTISMLCGTLVGLVVKYVLDKRWIFFDSWSGYSGEARKMSLYSLFGVFTTFVFWATELAFLAIWHTEFAKYLGAVVGLAVGYTAKYLLDRSFVFGTERR